MISFSIWFHFSVSSRKHTVAQKPEGNIYMRKVVLNKPYMRWKKEREKKNLGWAKLMMFVWIKTQTCTRLKTRHVLRCLFSSGCHWATWHCFQTHQSDSASLLDGTRVILGPRWINRRRVINRSNKWRTTMRKGPRGCVETVLIFTHCFIRVVDSWILPRAKSVTSGEVWKASLLISCKLSRIYRITTNLIGSFYLFYPLKTSK